MVWASLTMRAVNREELRIAVPLMHVVTAFWSD